MSRASAKSLPQLSLRIDLDGEDRIGPGKIELLEQIREQGSISGGRPRHGHVLQARLGSRGRDQPDLRTSRGRAAGRRQERRRRDADAVRRKACCALPEDRARRRTRGAQGSGSAQERHRPFPQILDSRQFGRTDISGIGCVSASPSRLCSAFGIEKRTLKPSSVSSVMMRWVVSVDCSSTQDASG